MKKISDERVERAIRDLQAGVDQEAAFKVLFDQYYAIAVHFFVRKGVDREESRDLAQDCFKNIFRSIKSFRREARFTTYFFSVANNVWKNHQRSAETIKRKVQLTHLDPVSEQVGDGASGAAPGKASGSLGSDGRDDPLDAAIHKERLDRALDCIEKLPAMPQRCLILSVFQGRSYKEISSLVGIGVGTVGSHIFEARRRLRICLEEGDQEPEEPGRGTGAHRSRAGSAPMGRERRPRPARAERRQEEER